MDHVPRLSDDVIGRREALRRAAMLLGGVLSAPAIAGVLAGCDSRSADGTWRALTSEQGDLVATIAEHIIPETDTPGARGARVPLFIDQMLAGHYGDGDRKRVLDGLEEFDERARRECGGPFIRCSADDQRALLTRVDQEAFTEVAGRPEVPWFRTIKELTILGYYTSEIGATQELRYVAVPERFDGCVPIEQVGRTWAV
ncbi:MAG TPA: gluconate 2-dehydrogenase subunit 3 family protein [Gemmatimonadaceae bacterium]|nr:gluconate 2-dehydrogenase subunit 3 family protein [Gemmatimonadaceae bacterium]